MMFRWATAQQLVPAGVLHGLTAVAPLKAGRTAAPERDPVRPVPAAVVDQTVPHLSAVVAAMVKLQMLSGCRPGEVCALTTGDIDRTGDVWAATPAEHKNAYRGHARTIMLGPLAQAIVLPFLNLAQPAVPVFSPAAADATQRAARAAARVTPASCGNVAGSNRVRQPKRQPGDRYTVASYRRAIARACDAAFPAPDPLGRREKDGVRAWRARLTADQRKALAAWQAEHRWSSHQLRHARATEVRKRFGLEGAQATLGHASVAATQIYAERSIETARSIALAIG